MRVQRHPRWRFVIVRLHWRKRQWRKVQTSTKATSSGRTFLRWVSRFSATESNCNFNRKDCPVFIPKNFLSRRWGKYYSKITCTFASLMTTVFTFLIMTSWNNKPSVIVWWSNSIGGKFLKKTNREKFHWDRIIRTSCQ